MNTGALAILLAATLFGTGGLYVKTLSLPATLLVAFRLFIPAVALLASSHHLRTRLLTHPSKTLAFASSLTALRILLWVIALRYASLSKAVFILYTWPIIFTFFNHKLFGERVSRTHVLILALSFCGILTMYSGETVNLDNNDIVGMTLMLLVAVLNAGVFASILCYTEVLSATVIGVVVFHEVLTWRVVLGGSIILICAAMARQMQSQRT